jgi:hypothetical protein
LVGQHALQLTLRNRAAERAQQGCRTGQGLLTLMILHQHEAARFGSEMHLDPLGQQRHDDAVSGVTLRSRR